jgi:cytidylate kinase
MIIAIDGPAASGKGTLAKRIADHYGLSHLDTGMLYRAVARQMILAGDDLGDPAAAQRMARALDPSAVDEPALRSRNMGEAASVVAQYPGVRAALLEAQRNFAAARSGAVVEGRDIGTVIFPSAEVKIYVTADLRERARRRYKELAGRGEAISEQAVFDDLEKRDRRDQSRQTAPLSMAKDAHLLDTTKMDIETAFVAAVRLIDAAIGRVAQN